MRARERKEVERFDRWAESYEDSYLQRLLFDRIHRVVLNMVESHGEPKALLDVGCGTGRLLRSAATRWPAAELIGVDPAPAMVETARRLTSGATFYNASAEALPLPDASIDAALSTMSFHHWADQAAGLAEVARVLRPGGYFFLTDAAPPAWIRWIWHHGHQQSAAAVRSLFEQAGLRVVGQQPVISKGVVATTGQPIVPSRLAHHHPSFSSNRQPRSRPPTGPRRPARLDPAAQQLKPLRILLEQPFEHLGEPLPVILTADRQPRIYAIAICLTCLQITICRQPDAVASSCATAPGAGVSTISCD